MREKRLEQSSEKYLSTCVSEREEAASEKFLSTCVQREKRLPTIFYLILCDGGKRPEECEGIGHV